MGQWHVVKEQVEACTCGCGMCRCSRKRRQRRPQHAPLHHTRDRLELGSGLHCDEVGSIHAHLLALCILSLCCPCPGCPKEGLVAAALLPQQLLLSPQPLLRLQLRRQRVRARGTHMGESTGHTHVCACACLCVCFSLSTPACQP